MLTLSMQSVWKTLRIVLYTLLGLFATLLSALLLLIGTESGSRLLLAQAVPWLEESAGISLNYRQVSGTFANGLDFQALELNMGNQGLRLYLGQLDMDWNLLLLRDNEVRILYLGMQALDLQLPPAGDDEPATEGSDMQALLEDAFNLPWQLRIDNFELFDSRIVAGEQVFESELLAGSFVFADGEARLGNVRFRSGPFSMAMDAMLDAGLNLALDLNWMLEDAADLLPGMPAETLAGLLVLNGDLEEIVFLHQLEQALAINSSGTVNTGLLSAQPPAFNLQHEIADLAHLLPADLPVSSLAGTITTSGSIDTLQLQADLALATELLEPLQILLDMTYSEAVIELARLELLSTELNLLGSGRINLQAAPEIDLDWQLLALDIGEHVPGIRLENPQGQGSISLQESDTGWQGRLELSEVTAILNGFDLQASGSAELLDNQPGNIRFDLLTGNNRLQAEGHIGDEYDLSWSVDAPNLAVFLPELSGRSNGQGSFSGTLDEPVITGELELADIAYLQYQLQTLQARFSTGAAGYSFNLQLAGLRLPAEDDSETLLTVSTAELSLEGLPEQHSGNLRADSDLANVLLAFSGSWQEDNWQGQLTESRLGSGYGIWLLGDTLALTLAGDAASFSEHCWLLEGSDLRICNAGNWSSDAGLQLNASLFNLPLSWLNQEETLLRSGNQEQLQVLAQKPAGLHELQLEWEAFMPAVSLIDGSLQAELNLAGLGAADDGDFDFQLQVRAVDAALSLLLERDEDAPEEGAFELRTFELSGLEARLARQQGAWQADSRFDVFQQEDSGLYIEGSFQAGFAMDTAENLSGGLQFSFPDIAWIETLLTDVRDTRGEFAGEALLGGTLQEPTIVSSLNLRNAAFELPALGIRPEQLQLGIRSNADNDINFDGLLVSGEGSLSFAGELLRPMSPDRSLGFSLQGNDFLAIDNINATATISPDIELTFADNALDIQGSVLVPHFMLDLRHDDAVLGSSSINVSRDVIIVDAPAGQERLLAESQRQQQIQNIPVTLDLSLLLGDDIRFRGYGLDLLLAGQLQIQQQAERPLLTYGDISVVEGHFEIYRQRLDVANGKLIFFGNPANPALDIRAFRLANNVRAGVQINGTIQNMQSRLYSTPSLPESEILSILITGKSFRNTNTEDQNVLLGAIASLGIERGQGITNAIGSQLGLDTVTVQAQPDLTQSSLGLGKYLTPELFLHYETGLFENESTVSINYFLTDRLKLEVRSGVSQSIDMIYNLER